MKIHRRYEHLYKTKDDLIIITGGRGSGKSFVVSDFACRTTFQTGEKILYTRYTLTSAKSSIIPEYKEKIEILNSESYFKITDEQIVNTLSGSSILFKGIKNSSGNQTANLKSIKDPTKWILDEAEEIPDYNTFQKIKRSLRKKGAKIQTILILNPPNKEHWIYKKFFEKNNVPDYFNGSIADITFIHTTYNDNIENLDETFLKDAENTKIDDFEEYENIFLGKWADISDSVLFKKSCLRTFANGSIDKSLIEGTICAIDFKLEGSDSFAAIFGHIYCGDIYIFDVIFNRQTYEYNIPILQIKINEYKAEKVRIETNSAGEIFLNQLRESCENANITGVFSKVHKLTRIIMSSGYILKHFIFRNDYERKSEYSEFIFYLTNYLKNGKTNINGKMTDDDDAPDVCSMAANMLTKF